MAKITRIKASDKPADHIDEPSITRKKVVLKDKKSIKKTTTYNSTIYILYYI